MASICCYRINPSGTSSVGVDESVGCANKVGAVKTTRGKENMLRAKVAMKQSGCLENRQGVASDGKEHKGKRAVDFLKNLTRRREGD